MGTFNPYLKWLGIPLKHQPPSHYRLLGVEQFESDADIIERAADRQMTYLRSLQAGEHAQAAQQLLNEIAAAKVCLLDAKRKAEYDEQLQKTAAAASGVGMSGVALAAAPAARPPARRVPMPGNSGLRQAEPLGPNAAKPATGAKRNGVAPNIVLSTPSATKPAGAAPESAAAAGNMLPLVIGGVAAGLFLLFALVIAVVAFMPGEETTVAEIDGTSNTVNDGTVVDLRNGNDTPVVSEEDRPKVVNSNSQKPPENETPATTGVGASNSTPTPGATLEIDAQFLLDTLANGERVLTDRDYVFASLAPELRGLDFTRWTFGPLERFTIKVERKGDIYLILPPDQYARELPDVSLQGWEATSLTCDVEIGGGKKLPCRVYRHETPLTQEIPVTTGAAIWPIIAADKIHKRTRILGDIVENDATPPTDPFHKPPQGGATGEKPTPRPPRRGETPRETPQEEPDDNKPPKSPKVARLKVPTSEAQKPVREKIAQLYDLDGLKESDDKLRVAKNLLDVARQPSDKPEERYVMLATSAQLAADAGDLLTALLAVETIGVDFDGDTSAMKLHLARLFAKSNVNANVKAQQLEHVLPIIDEGLANDHFEAIDQLVQDLLAARLRHPELAGRRRIALDMKDTYRKVTAARKTLTSNPEDPTANEVVGEYLCYYKLDWEEGLPHLAKADDVALREAATRDTANPKDGRDQLSVADRWFDIAKGLDAKSAERQKGSLLTRAQEWYERAASEVKGLDEAHAKKRLDEVQDELVKMGWVDVPRKATIVAACGYGFDCYLNGESLFDASYDVASVNTTLKRGDVLMFRATKSTSSFGSYGKGFACVIAFEGSKTLVATGLTKGWEGFVPADRFNWYRPDGVASTTPIVVSSGSGHQGVAARSIWYAAANTSEAYFFFRVR